MKTTGETGRKVPVPAMVTMKGLWQRATSRTCRRVASQSWVGVVVTSVMCAGTTSARGSPKEARQRCSSPAISSGKPRMTPTLISSLRAGSWSAAAAWPDSSSKRSARVRSTWPAEQAPPLAVTFLEDMALADPCEAEGRQETHALVHLAQGGRGDLPGPVRAEGQQPVKLGGIGHELVGPVAERGDEVHHHLREVHLEVPVHLPLVLGFKVRHGLSGEGRVNGEQVGNPGLLLGVEADVRAGVGHCRLDALCGDLGILQQLDGSVGVLPRRGHLGAGILEVVDLGAFLHGRGLRIR